MARRREGLLHKGVAAVLHCDICLPAATVEGKKGARNTMLAVWDPFATLPTSEPRLFTERREEQKNAHSFS
jgi:hypothetical protein